MARLIKKQKQELGLSPDTFFFRGEKKIDNILLRLISYNSEKLTENKLSNLDELKVFNNDSVNWLNIDGLHDTDLMEKISEKFNFEHLILADVMDTQSRPKIMEYSTCILITIKMLQYHEKLGTTTVENLSLLLSENVFLSFQEQVGDVFDPIRRRIRSNKKRIRTSGADYLLFAILDIVIDNYIYIISKLGDKIEDLENELLNDISTNVITEINKCKQELNFIRKNIIPAKDLIINLIKSDDDLISEKSEIHLKDLLVNINQAVETTTSYREILSDQLNIYHTMMSSKLNEIMKFLTVFSVIFIPITFIAGIYGTNFDFIPELHFRYSYFIMWGIIISVVIFMLFYFRKKKWF